MKMVITGATGTVGRQLIRILHRAGPDAIGISRDRNKADALGLAQIAEANPSNPPSMRKALQGAEALYVNLAATGPSLLDLIELARDCKVRRLVLQSALTVEYGGGLTRFSDAFAAAERLVRESGLEFAIIRCADFAANTRIWAGQIRSSDQVRASFGPAATACIHELDIAEVAAKMLMADEPLAATFAITGPEAVTQSEKVGQIGRALGRDIAWVEILPDEYRSLLVKAGVPEHVAERTIGYTADCLRSPGPTTNQVKTILGRPALEFQQWATENVELFR
jgi:uncharacterized protein YbjT (DUF2867 family)